MEIQSLFWGLRLESGKRYSATVDKSFHVSMAALDVSTVKSDHDILTVMLEEGESSTPFILCNLQKDKVLQCALDLNFLTGERISFFCKGTGVVHLSGFIVPEDPFDPMGDEDAEEEEEEEEDEDEDESLDDSIPQGKLNGLAGKRKQQQTGGPAKKKPASGDDSDDTDDDDDDDSDDDKSSFLSSLDLADSDDSDDDDDDKEDESDKEQVPVVTSQKKGKNKKKSTEAQTPKQQQQKKQQTTPNGVTPQQGKQNTKQESAQKLNKSNVDDSPQKKNGLQMKDLKVGNGPVCTKGKQATVYYTGRFKSNNKVFDSTTQGAGFKFRVGKGEVIKGWDIGVVGMKVGGKRLITCPPHMAYGPKGSPPTIPANSTLMFEVELKSVN